MKTSQALSAAKKLKSLLKLSKYQLQAFGNVQIANGLLTGFNGDSVISVPFLDGCRDVNLAELITQIELKKQLGYGQLTIDLLNLTPCEQPFTLPDWPLEFTLQFEADFSKVAAFASDDETRWVLNSVYFDHAKNCIVATNGSILGIHTLEHAAKGTASFILPIGAVENTSGLTTVFLSTNHVTIRLFDEKGVIQTFKLIEGRYPNYSDVIPDPKRYKEPTKCRVTIPSETLVKAAKYGIAKIKGTGTNGVVVSLSGEGTKVDDVVIDTTPFPKSLKATYNPNYLLTCAELFMGETALDFISEKDPLLLTAPNRLAVIMPMRMQ